MAANSIESILNDVFFDGTEKAISDLKQYELFDITQKQIDYFNESIQNKKVSNLDLIYTLFAQQINSKLININDSEVKERLKYLLSEIGNFLIDKLITENLVFKDDLIGLEEALKDAYNLLGYDFQDLKKRTQFSRIASMIENQKKNITVYYEWMKYKILFEDILQNLKSENIIKSIKDFRKLFTPNPVSVNINSDFSEFIIVLFDTLHEKKIIKSRGRKGHFTPLKNYSIDFDNNILFKKEMKHVKDAIKKNPLKHEQLKKKAEKWIYMTEI